MSDTISISPETINTHTSTDTSSFHSNTGTGGIGHTVVQGSINNTGPDFVSAYDFNSAFNPNHTVSNSQSVFTTPSGTDSTKFHFSNSIPSGTVNNVVITHTDGQTTVDHFNSNSSPNLV